MNKLASLRKKLIKAAVANPDQRDRLLPIIAKLSMEFPTQEAMKTYLQEHPGADKTKHKVVEQKKDRTIPEPKDTKRVSDILSKAGGKWNEKAKSLTQQMANSITEVSKANRRGIAAEAAGEKEMAKIFFNRAKELTRQSLKNEPLTKKKKEPVEKPEPQKDKKPAPASKTYTKTYKKPVTEVMDAYKLTDDDAEAVQDFKKAKPKKGIVKRSPQELMQEFLRHAKPETKERMKGVTPAEFMKMLGAIMDEEEGMGKAASLRNKLIRIAATNPDQRDRLLPIIARLVEAAETFEDWVKGKTFHNPETGNKVQFDSLPAAEQKKLREHWDEKEAGGTDEDKEYKESEDLPEQYKLSVVGDNKKRAAYVAKKMKKGIDENPNADICKESPPVCEGNLGLTRNNMPQLMDKSVKALLASSKESDRKKGQAAIDAGADPDDDRSTLDQFLDTLKEEGVKMEHTAIPVGQLKATQKEIKAGKTFSMAHSYFSGEFPKITEGEIVVSSDNHILDGHHRWAAMLVADPSLKMKVVKVDIPMKEFLRKSLQQPGIFRADIHDKVIPESEPLDLGDGPEKLEKKKPAKKEKKEDKKASLRTRVLKLALQDPELRPHLYRVLKDSK